MNAKYLQKYDKPVLTLSATFFILWWKFNFLSKVKSEMMQQKMEEFMFIFLLDFMVRQLKMRDQNSSALFV